MSKPISRQTMTVYAAGPITGCTFEECTDWRSHLQSSVPRWIEVITPLRAKQFLAEEGILTATSNYQSREAHSICSSRGVTRRDYYDVCRCDALFVNLIGASIISMGTMVEMGWAWSKHKPIVLAMEEEGNPHEHLFLQEFFTYRLDNVNDAIHHLSAMLASGDVG